MKAQSLKNAILQLAVQGKLVAQNPQDEPASELLKRIKAEKTKLIKEKKIKAEKPLAPITDEEKPFDIPESWEWVRLGTICTLNPRNALDDSTPVSFIPMSLIDDGYRSSFAFEKRLWKDVKSGFTHFSEGDIAVAKIIPCFDNRKSAIFVNLVNGVGAGTTELHIIRVIKETLLHNYVLWFLKTHYFINSGIKTYSGTAGQQRISKDFMENVLFPLPPLVEQQRIVKKIEQLMPLVEKYDSYEKELSALEAKFPDNLKKAVLKMSIQGKLVEQKLNDGNSYELFDEIKKYHSKLRPCKDELNYTSMDFNIPSSWRMVELNELFDFVDYRGKTPLKTAEDVFLITASNIRKGFMDYTRKEYISQEEYLARQSRGTTNKGDLLFTTEAPMGNVAICDLEICSCGQRIITFKHYVAESVCYPLFMYFILSPQFQSQLLENCTGTTAKGIKADKLKHLLVPLPPLAEQERIVQKVEQLLALCEVLADESKLKKYQPPKRLAKVIEFTPVETENEHEHLFAARADKVSPETSAKELERLALLRKKR